MLPYLAQGANSAIEDGAVLGLLLDNMTSRKQLPQALDMYQELRKARGEAIVRETFKQVRILLSDALLLCSGSERWRKRLISPAIPLVA